MFHPNTERLIDYWRSRRGTALLPPRRGIDPGAFTPLLPQVFILGRKGPGVYPVRLSGGFIAELHGRELKGEAFLSLWAHSDRPLVQSALEMARRSPAPVVIGTEVRARGAPSIEMEVMIAAMTGPDGEADRYLGLYQPLSIVRTLDGRPAYELGARHIAGAEGPAPRLRLAALDGRRIA